ncbi:hypothetical protein ACE41H_21850 [Paenibacillus enshidis]|uniref:Uncharacterized protein n=1 Tax=Paenibacillus enshidis TaxID=1458439 RepID=A0ABV5AYX4_9BACL
MRRNREVHLAVAIGGGHFYSVPAFGWSLSPFGRFFVSSGLPGMFFCCFLRGKSVFLSDNMAAKDVTAGPLC